MVIPIASSRTAQVRGAAHAVAGDHNGVSRSRLVRPTVSWHLPTVRHSLHLYISLGIAPSRACDVFQGRPGPPCVIQQGSENLTAVRHHRCPTSSPSCSPSHKHRSSGLPGERRAHHKKLDCRRRVRRPLACSTYTLFLMATTASKRHIGGTRPFFPTDMLVGVNVPSAARVPLMST
jgi:hypothetical protein